MTATSGATIFNSTLSANNGLLVSGPSTFKDTVTLGNGGIGSTFTGQVTLGKAGGMNLSGYQYMDFNTGILLSSGPASILTNGFPMRFNGGTVHGPYALTLDAGTGANATITGLNLMGTDLTGLTVSAYNPTIPSGTSVSIAGPQSYTAVSGSNILLNGNVGSTASGAITFNSPVLVGAASTVSSTNSAVNFNSTVDGANNLTVSSGSGLIGFSGAVGGTAPLGSGTGAALVLQGTGATTFSQTVQTRSGITAACAVTFDNNVTMTAGNTGSSFTGLVTSGGTTGNTISGYGGIAFNGGLSLTGGPVSILSNGSTLSFGAAVSGAQNLTLNALSGGAGTVTGLDQIGFTSSLTALSVTGQTLSLPSTGLAVAGPMTFTAPGGITLNGAVGNSTGPATGQIAFNNAVTLATGAIGVTTSNAAVSFAGSIDGAQALTVNAGTGATTFGGAIGATTALSSLTTAAGGTTAINGGQIKTSGAQTYNGPLTLGAATTLTSTGSGNITFGSSIDGAQTLAVNTAGATTFNGIVGGTNALTSLTTDAPGTVAINTTSVNTTGAQAFNENASLGANASLNATGITFGGTLDGAYALTANAGTGALHFSGATGATTPLTSLSASGNTIVVGLVTSSGTQSYSATGGVTLNGNLTTANNSVTITGPTTLGADLAISTGAGAGDIVFSGTSSAINGSHALTLSAGTGSVVLGGQVGGVTALNGVTLTGYDLTLPSITTVNDLNQSYTAINNITLNQSRTLNAPISFTAGGTFALLNGVSLTVSNKSLTIQAGDLDLQGSSTLSSGNALMTLIASGGNNILLGGTTTLAPGQMTISGSELSRISTSGGLALKTTGTGWIQVDGITALQSQNVTGALNLNAQGTGDISFVNTPSTFNAVTTDAVGGNVNVGVNLTTSNAAINFLTPVVVSGASTISSGGGNISFQNTVAVANDLTLSTGNGVLTFNGAVGSNKTLTLNLGGGSVVGLGQFQNTLTGLTVNGSSGITLPAFSINGPQTYNTGIITVTGDLSGMGITFNNVVNVSPSVGTALTLNSGTGTLAFNNLASFNATNMTLTGDNINFSNSVTGSGSLLMQPYTGSSNVAVGGTTLITGLNLTAAKMAWLPIGTLSSLTIGSASGTGSLDVAGAINAPGKPLTLNGGGGISQSGGVITSGALTLYAAGNPISLTNASNSFGAVAINGTPSAVSLTNTQDITQSGSAAWNLGTAPVTLNAGTHNITLNNAGNTFGTLSLTGATAQVTEAAGTDLGASTVNSLTVVSSGNISTSGTVAVTTLADLKTLNDAGASITIGNNSTFASVNAVSRNAADTANASGNISLAPATSALLKTLATTGNLTLNSASGQSLSQDATSTLSASGLELLGAGSQDLALGTNAISTLAGNTGTTTLTTTGGFVIGTVNTVGLTSSSLSDLCLT